MARYRGSTAERGLGGDHVADKKRLLALHRDGAPCWRCGQPMYKSQGLERDHMVDRALGGTNGPAVLAHQACNRAAGARLGNQMQPRVILAAGHDVICAACGKPYHYAPRACEICGVHYHPSGKTVRTCGRVCGGVLRRLNAGGKPVPFPAASTATRQVRRQPLPVCAICGKAYRARGQQICSRSCAWELQRRNGNYGPMTLRGSRQW